MNAKQLSEVIEEARKSKEMTQEEQLAKMLGIGILTASFYKNGVFKAIPFIEHTKMSSGLISLTRKRRASARTRLWTS